MPWGREFKAERVQNNYQMDIINYQMDIKVSQVEGYWYSAKR